MTDHEKLRDVLDEPDDFPEGRGIGCFVLVMAILAAFAIAWIVIWIIKLINGQV